MKKPRTVWIMTIFFLTWIIVIDTNNIYAQVKDPVEGTVKSEDGKPIEGAKVTLISKEDGTRHELTTSKNGIWRKPSINPGMWIVEVMAEGYTGISITVRVFPYRENKPIIVILSPTQESFLSKADSLYEQEKYKEALEEYQRVLAENPDLNLVYERIGLCYYELDDFENAIVNLKRFLEKKPQSKETLINLSIVYIAKGDVEGGMKYFNQLDEKSLKDPELFYSIGIALFRKRQIDGAIDFFNKGIAVDPNYFEAYYQLALAHINKGNTEEAKKNLQKVIELAPESELAASVKKMLETIK
jgi:Flp pilus assembly protein TadD